MTNRNRIKNWAITFPQTDVEREAFVDTFPPHEEAICCREEHDDGGYHLHLGIRLTKGLTKTRLLKWVKAKWPDDYKRIDIQATRSINQWTDYICKEDPDVYQHINAGAVEQRIKKLRLQEAIFLYNHGAGPYPFPEHK